MPLPTFSLIKVKDVKNDVYILENGGLRAVLSVSGVNFPLLSEQEQESLMGQFKTFLDGLDYSIEILIISRLENISDYLKILHLRLEEESNPLIKLQLEEYISFLEDYLENHKIMKKLFYIIVPYDPVEINLGFLDKLTKKNQIEEEDFQTKLSQLETRVSYVYESISGLGLLVKRLRDQELIELLFELYNPNLKWGQVPSQLIQKLTEIL